MVPFLLLVPALLLTAALRVAPTSATLVPAARAAANEGGDTAVPPFRVSRDGLTLDFLNEKGQIVRTVMLKGLLADEKIKDWDFTPDGFVAFTTLGNVYRIDELGNTKKLGLSFPPPFLDNLTFDVDPVTEDIAIVFFNNLLVFDKTGQFKNEKFLTYAMNDVNAGRRPEIKGIAFDIAAPDNSPVMYCFDGQVLAMLDQAVGNLQTVAPLSPAIKANSAYFKVEVAWYSNHQAFVSTVLEGEEVTTIFEINLQTGEARPLKTLKEMIESFTLAPTDGPFISEVTKKGNKVIITGLCFKPDDMVFINGKGQKIKSITDTRIILKKGTKDLQQCPNANTFQVFRNPAVNPFPAVQDTAAFATCP